MDRVVHARGQGQYQRQCRHQPAAAGRTITYRDTDRERWIAAIISTGVPAEYAQVLRPLTATLASGNGARPNSDVLDITGTAPATFAEFAAKTAPAWK